ncbi:MAG TPA: DegV family protein [Candidatus Avoscillospira avistercoris]|uniref:DegV family protein n=1 Tax=Candidatus Avoscillospira avistercoris TaxID=2840707 RepID=A0A9D1FAJ1_9FIRM|nr:DegV family protein [Candidatus Avoscillospira avistercoris]
MKRIAIVTDSNSGITQTEAKQLGISVLPMPFFIDDTLYFEDITLTQEAFYERLLQDADISTSQPSLGDVTQLWDQLLQEYESVLHIPMSSGLSSSCQSARMLADDYNGRVVVVDNQRISVTQRQSVRDAMALAEAGHSAEEIRTILEEQKLQASIYISLETLKYLKKGGRITPAAAAIGTVLNLKPVLQIQGEKLDAYAKVRGKKAARRTMIEAIQKDLKNRFAEPLAQGRMGFGIAYSGNLEEALDWKAELEAAFPGVDFQMDPLSLSVACHIGYGALACGCYVKAI